jgi:mxaA protein
MKNHYSILILAASLFFQGAAVQAQEAEARVTAIINPTQSNGIHLGDVLKRNVAIDVKLPYQLSKSAYPVKGTVRNGIELVDINVESHPKNGMTEYRMYLSYQVFAHANVPTVMQLPAEPLLLSGGPKALHIDVPAWHFWFSPLVSADTATAKANLQPQAKPEPIDVSQHRHILLGLANLLAGALIVLVYINADRRWLPFMGGAFAQAHRRIKRLSNAEGEERRALLYMHQAFNQTYGGNLFAPDLDAFVTKHPNFAPMQKEIADFFERSNRALFAAPPHDKGAFIRELTFLSKGLRNCERGLA